MVQLDPLIVAFMLGYLVGIAMVLFIWLMVARSFDDDER